MFYQDFAVLPGWADASALQKNVLAQLEAPSMFPMFSHFEPFRFIRSTFPGDEALSMEEELTLWNHTVNSGVVFVRKRSVDEAIAWYTSTTSILQNFLEENCA